MKTFITVLCFLSIATIASAAACVTGTYTSYEALGGGCSIGNATFSNFSSLSFVNSSGVPVLSPDQIIVTPSGTASDASLEFFYVNGNGAATPVTVNQIGQIFSFGFSFQILVSPGSLNGIEMDSNFANTSPGSASATKTAQLVGGGPTYTSTVSDGGISNSLGNYTGSLIPVAGSGAFRITDTTSLQAQTGSATQSGFTNSFALGAGTASTPEVRSSILMGSGLVLLSVFANVARRRQQRAASHA